MAFIYPPPMGQVGDYTNLPNFALNVMVTLEWSNLGPNASLMLLKDDPLYTCLDLNRALTYCHNIVGPFENTTESYNWVAQTYDYNYTSESPIFYLQMETNTEDFTSHYINILPEDQIPVSTTSTSSTSPTSSASSSITGTTTESPPPATITSSAASVSTTGSAESSPSGMDTATKTAIGVAVGLGVPLIAILAVIAFFLHKKKQRSRTPSRDINTNPVLTHCRYSDNPAFLNKYGSMSSRRNGVGESIPTRAVQELSGTTDQHASWQHASELSADSHRR
ncbi:uncharacterized protein Z518_06805 [Rhinocladiella mackenziei CBS 650.93]|uniref:Mid2 domain-containing protein n=1 Tax=Rhinocladiella mackenziei CBS 650.93 TaxID=1442369 RepID=A0A0D2GYG4_9EURO|nr:uncharacterized protein Z518_06805 [Rhinocladiella mackenziei CBS 650.93]KIX03253.1 hypothetical protein Z518_06805 [Rhinocladiella mackenziei CBS 650.93]